MNLIMNLDEMKENLIGTMRKEDPVIEKNSMIEKIVRDSLSYADSVKIPFGIFGCGIYEGFPRLEDIKRYLKEKGYSVKTLVEPGLGEKGNPKYYNYLKVEKR